MDGDPYGSFTSSGWTVGPFQCLDNRGTCLTGALCPCYRNYRTAELIGESGVLYCLLSPPVPLCMAVGTVLLRKAFKEHHHIDPHLGEDLMLGIFCTSCVICQMANELDLRGL